MSDKNTATIQISHRSAHAPEQVFEAWLTPEFARQFLFHTETGQIVRCDIDPRVGGIFTITDRRNGQNVEHTGEYLEIDSPHRLKFTFGVPAFSADKCIVTIEIQSAQGGCELNLTAEKVLTEWADRTQAGWSKILQKLEDRLNAGKV